MGLTSDEYNYLKSIHLDVTEIRQMLEDSMRTKKVTTIENPDAKKPDIQYVLYELNDNERCYHGEFTLSELQEYFKGNNVKEGNYVVRIVGVEQKVSLQLKIGEE